MIINSVHKEIILNPTNWPNHVIVRRFWSVKKPLNDKSRASIDDKINERVENLNDNKLENNVPISNENTAEFSAKKVETEAIEYDLLD